MENKTVKLSIKERDLIGVFMYGKEYGKGIYNRNFTWNEVMPIVEKIQNLEEEHHMRFGFGVMVNIGMRSRFTYCHIEDWRGKDIASCSGATTLIGCVLDTVITFIKWYNNHGKQD